MKAKILIAEDQKDLREILTELLELEGYDVTAVEDGLQAWEYLTEIDRLPDLLITDIMMPNMDGIQLVENITNSDKLKNLRVVVYSASPQFKCDKRLKYCQFFSKPFELNSLLESIGVIVTGETICGETQS